MQDELEEQDVAPRAKSARAPEQADDEQTVRTLSKVLWGCGSNEVEAMYAAEALAKIGSPKAVKALCSELSSGGDWVDLKAHVCRILVSIGPAAVEELCLMLNNENYTARTLAANVLAMIGDARAVKPLRKRLSRINNPVHQFVSWALLERIDYGHGVRKTTWHAETDSLLNALAKCGAP